MFVANILFYSIELYHLREYSERIDSMIMEFVKGIYTIYNWLSQFGLYSMAEKSDDNDVSTLKNIWTYGLRCFQLPLLGNLPGRCPNPPKASET